MNVHELFHVDFINSFIFWEESLISAFMAFHWLTLCFLFYFIVYKSCLWSHLLLALFMVISFLVYKLHLNEYYRSWENAVLIIILNALLQLNLTSNLLNHTSSAKGSFTSYVTLWNLWQYTVKTRNKQVKGSKK
jgi:hypothetical protein